ALYARQGDVKDLKDPRDLNRNIFSQIPDFQSMADLDATLAWTGKNGGDVKHAAITGFCWGGRIVWLYAAHNPKLKAAAAWYGRLTGPTNDNNPKQPVDVAGDLKAPVLGLYGGKDNGIPMDSIEKMRDAIKNAGGKSTIQV